MVYMTILPFELDGMSDRNAKGERVQNEDVSIRRRKGSVRYCGGAIRNQSSLETASPHVQVVYVCAGQDTTTGREVRGHDLGESQIHEVILVRVADGDLWRQEGNPMRETPSGYHLAVASSAEWDHWFCASSDPDGFSLCQQAHETKPGRQKSTSACCHP